MSFYVYILKSIKNDGLYIGSTEDLENRLKQHNAANRKTYTARRGPWELVHSEEHSSRSEAVLRENFLKSCAGAHEKKQLANKG